MADGMWTLLGTQLECCLERWLDAAWMQLGRCLGRRLDAGWKLLGRCVSLDADETLLGHCLDAGWTLGGRWLPCAPSTSYFA